MFSWANVEPVGTSMNMSLQCNDFILEPYVTVDFNLPDFLNIKTRYGVNHFSMGFVVARDDEDPALSWWLTREELDSKLGLFKEQVNGINYAISLGGGVGVEPAFRAESEESLYKEYKELIEKFGVRSLDFCILNNYSISKEDHKNSQKIRASVIKRLKSEFKDLRISYSFPCEPEGLGEEVVATYLNMGYSNADTDLIDEINLFAFDFYDSIEKFNGNIYEATINGIKTAMEQTRNLSVALAVTLMIGRTDAPGEILTQEVTREIVKSLKEEEYNERVKKLKFWSLNRDDVGEGNIAVCSGLNNIKWEFLEIFSDFCHRKNSSHTGNHFDKQLEDLGTEIQNKSHIVEPYVSVDINIPTSSDLLNIKRMYNVDNFSIGFIVARDDGGPGLSWWSTKEWLDSKLGLFRGKTGGIRYTLSFGGAVGTELAFIIEDKETLYQEYKRLIQKFGVRSLDFDIEGETITQEEHHRSQKMRSSVIKRLKKEFQDLYISYTLPCEPKGLGKNSLAAYVYRSVYNPDPDIIDEINILVFDFYDSIEEFAGDVYKATISGIEAAMKQTEGMRAGIAVTLMIGNTDAPNEIYTQEITKAIVEKLKEEKYCKRIKKLKYWSLNCDEVGEKSTVFHSGLNKKKWEFLEIFSSFQCTESDSVNPPI